MTVHEEKNSKEHAILEKAKEIKEMADKNERFEPGKAYEHFLKEKETPSYKKFVENIEDLIIGRKTENRTMNVDKLESDSVSVNQQLANIQEDLLNVIKNVKSMSGIEGDTIDLSLISIEKKVDLLRELVDFRMGKFE